MDTMSSALVLWLGLSALVPAQPTYEIDNFYTYDRHHKQQPLLMQGKVFVPVSGKATEFYLSKGRKVDGLKVERLRTPHLAGWIVSFDNNRLAIEFMAKLAKEAIPHSPIVRWEGVDSIPTNIIAIKAKPFVTEKLIRLRLEKNAKLKIVNLEKVDDQWLVEVSELSIPPNILVLANLLSEDTVWLEWARVVFTPVHSPITGSMSITAPAVLNLGYEKQLDVVITVYKPTVKIRKDLLPRLGHNQFVPFPQKDEVWCEYGQPKITEEVTPEKTVIRITTPFRYLNYGKIWIPAMTVAYDDGKNQATFQVPGVEYANQSVIAGTDIDDIQPMPVFPPAASPPDPGEFTRVVLPWRLAGLIGGAVGLGFLLLAGGIDLARRARMLTAEMDARLTKNRLWQDLGMAVIPRSCTRQTWREVYKDTSTKLAKVLSVFYNIDTPVSADSVDDPALRGILQELEKLYQPDATPDPEKLANDIKHFVQESRKHV